uniref:Reverse transcriptase domain-containing protein n=1 Tax=Tanacetum cinerariifolium TaxID=118510 RepID=A0A6L2N124_TANCI|nr:reverse transcriptase domain-containing protein [Tanacetum cinerariifolium]
MFRKKLKDLRSVTTLRVQNTKLRGDLRRRLRSRRSRSMSRSPEPNPSVFSRIRRDMSESPRHKLGDKGRREGGIFNRLRVKGEVCPHTRRAVTKVSVQKERNLPPESANIKERLHEERNHPQRVKIAEEDTRSQNRKNKSQALKRTTYLNRSEDPEDHLKIFQAAAKVKRWAMPTWCHMFNSTLTGSARVWHESNRKLGEEKFLTKGEASEPAKDACESKKPNDSSHRTPHWFQRRNHMANGTNIATKENRGCGTLTSTWMNFVVVRSPSPYNGIIGRPGVRKIQAVPSTAHGMLKFPVPGGILALQSSKIIPLECTMVSRPETQPSDVTQATKERIKVVIHLEYLEQTIAIGSTLTEEGRKKLCDLLRLGQKKRSQTPKRNKAIQEEVDKLVDAGIIKEVHYHSWLANPIMVKKHDNSWRMCVDFRDKDRYSLLEIDWKVESLYGYPFKSFLDAYKGYHQIKMAKEDEEKTMFITSHGIFCYSKMHFGLKNARGTYQRLVDKAFHKQIGRNLEVYVDDLVIKSRTEQ